MGEPTIRSACFPRTVSVWLAFLMPFLPFVYGYPSSSPHAHCTPNKSVPTLHYTRRHGPIIIYRSMPVGTYQVQSPGIPKIIFLKRTRFVIIVIGIKWICMICLSKWELSEVCSHWTETPQVWIRRAQSCGYIISLCLHLIIKLFSSNHSH